MAVKNYHKAIEKYTDALEIKRDFMILYTNRALAYTRVYQYELAIKDCTKLLDYSECFEDGWIKSYKLNIKVIFITLGFLQKSYCS